MQLAIEDFSENLIEFKTHRILNAKPLWIDAKKISSGSSDDNSLEGFTHKHAYAIKNNQFFDDIVFDETQEKIVKAERYGGAGVGTNGGGARCGNDRNFQIKGIGKNPLALNTHDHWHSYGGLNLVDAIYETINAGVFGKILPIGVASIYGIIVTGKNTAILPGMDDKPMEARRSYGALLVREACVRPAHFFRCPFFKPEKSRSRLFMSDVARVRNVNKSLALKFNDTKGFINQIGLYLANYANQFAFARAARISHGSISPSNMCLDGRWLDLTNTSFLDGARNVCGSVPFYSEPEAVMEMLGEFIYTFSKYNGLSLNPSALLKYFVEQFRAYYKMHVSYVIGVPYANIPEGISNVHFRFVADVFSSVICSARKVSAVRAYEYQDNDPVICLIEAMYMSLVNSEAADSKFSQSITPEMSSDATRAFSAVMTAVYESSKNKHISYRNFIIAKSIISLKRALVPEYFYMGRLENYIYEMVKNKKEDLFLKVIEDSLNVADWAFDLEEGFDVSVEGIDPSIIIIFKCIDFSILFNSKSGLYEIFRENKGVELFESFDAILQSVRPDIDSLTVSNYCFLKYLERLASTIRILENI